MLRPDPTSLVFVASPEPVDIVAAGRRALRADAAAFRAAVYLLRRAANLPLKQVAGRFGISQPWVSRIQSRIEQGETDRNLRRLLRRYNIPISPESPRGKHQYDSHIV